MIKRIKKLTHGENGLKSASIILIITLFMSNLLGFLRDHYLSRNLPVQSTDIYYAAFRLPDLVLNLMILGAISSALMPVFNRYLQKDDEKRAWHVANAVITIAFIVLTSAIVILFFLMPLVIHLIVPNFSTLDKNQTIMVSRILLLSPLLFGISYLYTGVLNSFKRFFAPAIAPLIYNGSIIFGTIVLAPMYPRGDQKQIIVLALSVVFGALLHMLIQIPSMKHVGFKFKWTADYKDIAVRQIGKLMIPRTIALGANQIMFTAFTAFASASHGTLSYFTYANNIQTMPSVVFGLSFATAVFPSLSTAHNQDDDVKFSYYARRTMRIIIAVLIPISALLILLRVGIEHAILAFSLHEAKITADTLALFSISLVFSGLVPLLARCFFAMENTITPTIISLVASVSSIIFAYFLKDMGAPGLALAFSCGVTLNATLLYLWLRRRHKIIPEKELFMFTAKVLAATLIMSYFVQILKGWTGDWFDVVSQTGVFMQVIVCGLAGVGIYFGLAYLFKIKEVGLIWKRGAKN